MESLFNNSFFSGNRRRLRELFTGTAPIIMTANGLLQRAADSAYPFAQDANFWYLTGIDEPDVLLVMDRDNEYLIVPGRSASREDFDGAVNAAELTRRSGIKTVVDEAAGWEMLEARVKKVKHVATAPVPAAYVQHYGIYTNPARAALLERLRALNPKLELLDLGPHVVDMRSVKQPEELAAIQAAIDLTVQGFKAGLNPAKLKKWSHEYQVEAELAAVFRRSGAKHAYEPIVAGGARACTLHYIANNAALSADELLLVDAGAEVEHYAADITRTRSLRQPTPRQQAVYAAVLAVQQYALGLLKPGTLYEDYEHKVEAFMGKQLQGLGLIKDVSHEAVRRYYPHSTSHFLGLNVHDVGDYKKPLEAGMVMTVEPGIYIKEEGLGIRIEDDVLITPKGHKVLSAKLPRELY